MRVNIPKYDTGEKDIIRIHKHDTFACDHVIAKIAYKLLKKFKVYSERHIARDHAFVDEIMWALKQCYDDTERSKFYRSNGKKWKTQELEDGKHLLIETGITTDREGLEKFEERVQAGLELFGKEFRSLWW